MNLEGIEVKLILARSELKAGRPISAYDFINDAILMIEDEKKVKKC